MALEINNDMTEAVMEKFQDKLKIMKKIEDNGGDLFSAVFGEREIDRFYGTKVNEDVLLRAWNANTNLDIIGTMDDAEIEMFEEPNPRCREAIVAFTIHNGVKLFKGKVYEAFRRLVESSDNIMVMPRENESTRFVFSFEDLWLENRLLTDEEIEEEKNNFMEGIDYDEIAEC